MRLGKKISYRLVVLLYIHLKNEGVIIYCLVRSFYYWKEFLDQIPITFISSTVYHLVTSDEFKTIARDNPFKFTLVINEIWRFCCVYKIMRPEPTISFHRGSQLGWNMCNTWVTLVFRSRTSTPTVNYFDMEQSNFQLIEWRWVYSECNIKIT